MADSKDLRTVADRIEELIQELSALPDPHARAQAEEVVRLLMEMYGAGLSRILEIVDTANDTSEEVFNRFAEDDLVASLLVLHGLHPLDVEARIVRALDRVRPYLGSHGGDVTFIGVARGVLRLRLEGNCHDCPSSTITMKLAIERAIAEVAPEVTNIEVEGISDPM